MAALRWGDLDEDMERIVLVDQSRQSTLAQRSTARTTKTRCSRTLPVHRSLKPVLENLKLHAHPDGRVFHGPEGGILKPDTLRNILKREVLSFRIKSYASPRRPTARVWSTAGFIVSATFSAASAPTMAWRSRC